MSEIYDFIPKPGVARFFLHEKERDVRYLMRRFGVPEDTAYDAFCEGCHAMLSNIHDGKLSKERLSGSLESYLQSCCRNQLLKIFEKEKRRVDIQHTKDDDASWEENIADGAFCFGDGTQIDTDTAQHESDLKLMEQIVMDLPSPCEDLIWGKVRHGFSPADMACRLGYSSPRVAITTLSRCMKKLRERFKHERTLIDE